MRALLKAASQTGGGAVIAMLLTVTTFWIFLGSGVLASLIFIVLGPKLAPLLAGGDKTMSADLFVWIALPVGLGALYSYLSGILNGFRAIGRVAVAKIVGAVTIALMAYPACLLFSKGYTVAFIWLVSSDCLFVAGSYVAGASKDCAIHQDAIE